MSLDCLELFARRKKASSFISIAIWAGGDEWRLCSVGVS